MPDISIIVPVYKVENYLKRCIESILAQTYQAFELILVDDGSPDQCGAICDAYALKDKRLKVIHQNNSGQSSARNVGLDIAQGDYIGFVDSDDWIANDMYEYLLSLITTYNCDIAEVAYCITGKQNNSPPKACQNQIIVSEGEDILRRYLYTGMKSRMSGYPVFNKLYKAHLFEQLRFDKIGLCEDYLLNYQLMAQSHKYVISNKVCYFYFQRPESTLHGNLKQKDFDFPINCLKVSELANEKGDQSNNIKELAAAKVARCYFSLLAKATFYGIASEINEEEIKYLYHEMRKNYWKLALSPMSINRKLAMTVLMINPAIIKWLGTIKKSIFQQ
jgi:glycosyltransferase involved in cell wall biosynthesis